MAESSNVIFLEWLNKKSFPQGAWMQEPDLCSWEHHEMACIIIRDMSLGVWKGFVGVATEHIFYSKSIKEILNMEEAIDAFFSIYGGICSAGPLIKKYKHYSRNLWWVGIETSHGSDFMPLLKLDCQNTDVMSVIGEQTYKNFVFIRRETNKLAKSMARLK